MSSKKSTKAKKPAGTKSYLPFVIIGAVLAAVVVTAALMFGSDEQESNRYASTNANASRGASGTLPAPPPRSAQPGAQPPHTKGGANAPVVLEEFGDYQCPPCGTIHPVLQRIEDDYGDRVQVVFRHFPLQQIHKNAFTAARAAEAAAKQGKFWQMHDLIYKNQVQWQDSPEPRPIFTDYARRLDLNVDKFKADMESDDVTSRVVADINRGNSLNVRGTPTVFLNGRELSAENTLTESKLRGEIDAALAASGQGKRGD